MARRGNGWRGWLTTGCQNRESFTPGRASGSPSDTQGGSRMREFRTYGSERGAFGNGRPYRDHSLLVSAAQPEGGAVLTQSWDRTRPRRNGDHDMTQEQKIIRAKLGLDLLRESGEFPMSDEELDDTATTVYEGICGRSGPPRANQRSNAARDRR